MIEWPATLFSLVGLALNILKRKESFLVWFVANALWAGHGVVTGTWGLVLTQGVFAVGSVIGYLKWRAGERCA